MAGPEIGKMHQGSPERYPDAEPVEAGTPSRVHYTKPVPRGEQHEKETPTTVGRNTGMPR
jgi:hypothetical protein